MLIKPPVLTKVVTDEDLIQREWNLFFQYLATGDAGALWTPIFTGLTGVPVITAKWFQKGQYQVFFTVTLTGTSSATAGTTYCTFPDSIGADTVIGAANSTTFIALANGLAVAATQRLYMPTWSVTNQVITISGTVETK